MADGADAERDERRRRRAGRATPAGRRRAARQPDEEELRRRLEEELRKLRVEDVLLQSVVSLINLTSRRIAKEDERDLEQAQVGIEAVRALADLLPDEPAAQVRQALSRAPGRVRARGERWRGGAARAASRRPSGEEPSPGAAARAAIRPVDPSRLVRLDSARLRALRGADRATLHGRTDLTDFLTDYGVVFALGCAGAAVVYGALITQRLLAKSPGNERMQEISGAVQEGAQRLPEAPVHDHRRGRRRARDPARDPPGRRDRDRLRDRRDASRAPPASSA